MGAAAQLAFAPIDKIDKKYLTMPKQQPGSVTFF